MGIDGVVADHPGDRAGIEQQRRRSRSARTSPPSHQRAPGEGEAEHDLRPTGDPLHQRIDRDNASEAMPVMIAKRLNCTAPPIRSAPGRPGRPSPAACLPVPPGSAVTASVRPGVEVAVGDVVPGAAGATHDEGADEEQHHQPAAIGRRPARCRRRARPTTSMASATARSRSAGRNGKDANTAATRTARRIDPVAGGIGNAGRDVAHLTRVIV